jgi:hypothetical protein
MLGANSSGMSSNLIYPNGAVASRPDREVKVHYVDRPPTPWSWAIYVEGRPVPAYTSADRFRSAEEAWEAGRKILMQQGQRSVP